MTVYSPGDIVLVKFPFSDLKSTKKRPALVLITTKISSKSSIVTVAMITSKIDNLDLPGDVLLEDWEKSKLLFPSLCRLSKTATLEDELIDQLMGRLSSKDKKEVQLRFKKIFKDWIEK